jgi:hypothetical protein
MLPFRGVMQRRLVTAAIASTMTLVPLSGGASSAPDIDPLWNQPDGVSVDSAFYAVQVWWDGMNHTVADDPTQRGLDELAQANADLLNAYNLLQEQRTNPGPHAVAVIDPLLTSIYNVVTGSNIKAPIGSFFNWLNQRLLTLEGRGSATDITRRLLQDYRVKQAVAARDLHRKAGTGADALLTANALREQVYLLRLKAVSTPADGLTALLKDADDSTTALATRHPGDGIRTGNSAKGSAGTPPDNSQPHPKK